MQEIVYVVSSLGKKEKKILKKTKMHKGRSPEKILLFLYYKCLLMQYASAVHWMSIFLIKDLS